MKNRFFEIALRSAGRMLGKKTRLLLVLAQLAGKVKDVDWKNVKVTSARDKFLVLGRMVKAYALGHYRDVPVKTILLIIAAVIYFISPVDLLPDLIPITGLSDDFGILLWVYNSVLGEIDKFLTGEKSRLVHEDSGYSG
ncbi:MAG TPA: YkvA family protein [Chryseosolibacter sp.]|nr:YkvA family protein [Chryseosolibacter sp.]